MSNFKSKVALKPGDVAYIADNTNIENLFNVDDKVYISSMQKFADGSRILLIHHADPDLADMGLVGVRRERLISESEYESRT